MKLNPLTLSCCYFMWSLHVHITVDKFIVVNPCPRVACGRERVKVVGLLVSVCVVVSTLSHFELCFLQ